jgi:hypothetical protein
MQRFAVILFQITTATVRKFCSVAELAVTKANSRWRKPNRNRVY